MQHEAADKTIQRGLTGGKRRARTAYYHAQADTIFAELY
jgi:hypothetical protein